MTDEKSIYLSAQTHSLLWKDVFYAFVKANLKELRIDWDNGSSNVDKIEGIKTYSACQQECLSYNDCKQWSYIDGKCSIAKQIMLGQPKMSGKEDKRAFSGWIMDRVEAFEQDNQACEINWDYRQENGT